MIIKLEEDLGEQSSHHYFTGLLLSIAYAASIGGIATLVGTPPNLSFARIAAIIFPDMPEISFADWFLFAVPVTLLMFLAAWTILYFMFRPDNDWKNLNLNSFKKEYALLGKPKPEEKIVLFLFVLLTFLWIFREGFHIQSVNIPGWAELLNTPSYINDGTVAIFIALILFVIPSKTERGERLMNWETANKIPWGIVLLFGGGFALAQGFVDSGLSVWFGEQLAGLSGINPVILVLAIVTMISILTQLTSNVATTEMILPILAGLAVTIKVNPLLLMVPATLTASLAFMLPVATPPNAIVFGSNRIKIKEMMRAGFLLNIAGIILATLFMYIWGTVVFGIDVQSFPDWALGKG